MRELQETASCYDTSTGPRDRSDRFDELYDEMDEKKDKLRRNMKR